jgi:hypothetical protein
VYIITAFFVFFHHLNQYPENYFLGFDPANNKFDTKNITLNSKKAQTYPKGGVEMNCAEKN